MIKTKSLNAAAPGDYDAKTMEDTTETAQALWNESVIAFSELDDICERAEGIYAALRFAPPGSDTYKRIENSLKQIQTKWDFAFDKFTEARAKFIAQAQATNITDALMTRLIHSPINCPRVRRARTVLH